MSQAVSPILSTPASPNCVSLALNRTTVCGCPWMRPLGSIIELYPGSLLHPLRRLIRLSGRWLEDVNGQWLFKVRCSSSKTPLFCFHMKQPAAHSHVIKIQCISLFRALCQWYIIKSIPLAYWENTQINETLPLQTCATHEFKTAAFLERLLLFMLP